MSGGEILVRLGDFEKVTQTRLLGAQREWLVGARVPEVLPLLDRHGGRVVGLLDTFRDAEGVWWGRCPANEVAVPLREGQGLSIEFTHGQRELVRDVTHDGGSAMRYRGVEILAAALADDPARPDCEVVEVPRTVRGVNGTPVRVADLPEQQRRRLTGTQTRLLGGKILAAR